MLKPIGKIGIFDSGLGGLTVLKALTESLPELSYVYLGDTARTPYGSKSPSTVKRYSRECAEFLNRQGIDLLVVACNTASSVALDEIQSAVPCPVVGTIEPAVEACFNAVRQGPIGVIGTRATISSRAYQERLKERAPELPVLATPCPLFVPLVEEGLYSGPIVEQVIQHYCAPLKDEGVKGLILACTHYPLLMPAIEAYFGSETVVVECAHAISRQIKASYRAAPSRSAERTYFVTDEVSRFNALASMFLKSEEVQAIKVEELSAA